MHYYSMSLLCNPEYIITCVSAAAACTSQPNFYAHKRNMTALEYSRCCFTTEWTDFARNLSCPCGSGQCCTGTRFAGPAWGHINVYPSTFKWFLE
jgi:hypothetical protein